MRIAADCIGLRLKRNTSPKGLSPSSYNFVGNLCYYLLYLVNSDTLSGLLSGHSSRRSGKPQIPTLCRDYCRDYCRGSLSWLNYLIARSWPASNTLKQSLVLKFFQNPLSFAFIKTHVLHQHLTCN